MRKTFFSVRWVVRCLLACVLFASLACTEGTLVSDGMKTDGRLEIKPGQSFGIEDAECLGDENDLDAGACGCDGADNDADGDGTPDCSDGCPNDAAKTEPGVCGCGFSDVDLDGDLVADCEDECPADSQKATAGLCGCGVTDADSDDDGTPDCRDGCPEDPGKIAPGVCGCGGAIAPTSWYPDCDGDGQYASAPTKACTPGDASEIYECADGFGPDGGWSAQAGDDCDDEDTTVYYTDGDGDCRPVGSCLELLTQRPSASDGEYSIDPDGPGGNDPFVVTCDMTNGGWIVVYREDFSSGDQSGWHDGFGAAIPVDAESSCASHYGEMLGGYGVLGRGAKALKTFYLRSVEHTEVSVELDYIPIDSWDGESGIVSVDGVESWTASFQVTEASENKCGGGWNDPEPQRVHVTRPHTENTISVMVTSTLDSCPLDESFGVGNVLIRVR